MSATLPNEARSFKCSSRVQELVLGPPPSLHPESRSHQAGLLKVLGSSATVFPHPSNLAFTLACPVPNTTNPFILAFLHPSTSIPPLTIPSTAPRQTPPPPTPTFRSFSFSPSAVASSFLSTYQHPPSQPWWMQTLVRQPGSLPSTFRSWRSRHPAHPVLITSTPDRLVLTYCNRCFGDKGDVEDITEGTWELVQNASRPNLLFFSFSQDPLC